MTLLDGKFLRSEIVEWSQIIGVKTIPAQIAMYVVEVEDIGEEVYNAIPTGLVHINQQEHVMLGRFFVLVNQGKLNDALEMIQRFTDGRRVGEQEERTKRCRVANTRQPAVKKIKLKDAKREVVAELSTAQNNEAAGNASADAARYKQTRAAAEIWAEHVDGFVCKRRSKKLDRDGSEPPVMIAKVRREGGELWLGGVPTMETLAELAQHKFALQIQCSKLYGVVIPNALLFKLDMDSPSQALEDWPKVVKVLTNSLQQGDNAYIHGVIGVNKVGLAGSMCRAVLHEEEITEAIRVVSEVCHIRTKEAMRAHKSNIDTMLKVKASPIRVGPSGWMAHNLLVHAMVVEDGIARALCTWNQKKEQDWKPVDAYRISMTLQELDASIEMVCKGCCAVLPASRIREVDESRFVLCE
jgi:hypothetical protein